MLAPMKTVKVLIMDKNKYFMEGLRCVISDFHLSKDITVKFIDWPECRGSVDILFQSIGYGVMGDVWKTPQLRIPHSGMASPLLFLIRDSKDTRLSHIFQSVRQCGTVYRNQPVDTVNRMLEEAMFVQGSLASSVNLTEVIQQLTLREREVLQYMIKGKSLIETASVMRLKNKTVSTHKRSAMRKLNFKRNQELYHWLLQGGLDRSEMER